MAAKGKSKAKIVKQEPAAPPPVAPPIYKGPVARPVRRPDTAKHRLGGQ